MDYESTAFNPSATNAKKLEPVGIEPTCIKIMSIPEGPEQKEKFLFFFMNKLTHEEKKKKDLSS